MADLLTKTDFGGDDSAPPLQGPQAATPKQIGRYSILYELAVGGMSEIFLARQTGPKGFERPVVIKRILRHLAIDPRFTEMFLDEARLAAQINHPNVIQIFELGEVEDTYFMAMEYLAGESVSHMGRELFRRGRRFDPILPAYIVSCAAAGLHQAHEMRAPDGTPLNVVHRDVSPQNIFVTYDGQVKVLDFGIAKAAGRLSHTRSGTLKGKFAYMSPEQAETRELDRRSDVFSLGIVLYELTLGRRLYGAQGELQILRMITQEEPTRPTSIQPDYPPALEAIVMRALEKDPAKRFQTARDMKRALDAFVVGAGKSIGAEEVADLMRDLFADRIELKLKLLSSVQKGEPLDIQIEKEDTEDSLRFSAPSRLGAKVTTVTSAEVPVRRRLGGAFAWGGMVVALAGIGIGGWLATHARAVSPRAQPAPVAAPPTVTVPAVAAGCRAQSEPPGAAVLRGSDTLCVSTPCDLPASACAVGVSVEFRAAGFRAATAVAREGRLFARLEPDAQPGAAARPVAHAPHHGRAPSSTAAGAATPSPQPNGPSAVTPPPSPPPRPAPPPGSGPRWSDMPPL